MEIEEKHVEWAVVDRLRIMLEGAPPQGFDVTYSFALFSAICSWVRKDVGRHSSEREWPRGLGDLKKPMTSPPWELPNNTACGKARVKLYSDGDKIKIDLSKCNAWEFVVWLRNTMTHGDQRRIKPIHEGTDDGNPSRTLTGFRFGDANCHAILSGSDMRRIGIKLAQVFCGSVSEGPTFEDDAKKGVGESEPHSDRRYR